MHTSSQHVPVFGDESDDEPEPDGRQFDAVNRFEEPVEPDLGPDVPEPPEPDGDTHPRVQMLFWALVVVFNVAVLGVGVGLLLIVFDGNLTLGGQVLAGGLVLLGYGLYRYRDAKREVATITGDEDKG
jgi:hypothetical protein